MIYGATKETPTEPTLIVEAGERQTAAKIVSLDSSVEPWVVDYLKSDAPADSQTVEKPAVLRGAPAARVRTVIGEAAAGAVFTGALNKVNIGKELQRAAQQLIGSPTAEAANDDAGTGMEITPSAPDRLIINGLKKVKTLTNFHSGYIPRHADTGQMPVQLSAEGPQTQLSNDQLPIVQPEHDPADAMPLDGHFSTDEFHRLVDDAMAAADGRSL